MQKTLSVEVFNEPGILTRICTTFSSRGFNINSIAVGPTEKVGISRITLVVPANDQLLDQIIKQLYKLVQIIEVKDLTMVPCIERELILIKVRATSLETRLEITNLIQIFRSHIVDISRNSITLEITGDPGKTEAITRLLEPFEILAIVRAGKISMPRDFKSNTEFLKNL
jgi:acetolactate synthase-1/3 small subunit